MSKLVMVVLWLLVGLALLVAGVLPNMMRYGLIIAGILVIILAIVLLLKKHPEVKAPAK